VKTRLTDAEKTEIWRAVAAGESFRGIARRLNRSGCAVRWLVTRAGGFAPPPARRSELRLSLAEREEISRGLVAGETFSAIAGRLGRAGSTVSREVATHGGRRRYRAHVADAAALAGMARPKISKMAACPRLRAEVEARLELRWSPQQIARSLRDDFPKDPEMRVSHETIYQTLYLQARGELRTELKLALRQGRARRVNRSRASCSKGKIRDMVNISERPAEAEDRAVPGFWEGDLIIGKANASQVATLVERTTRFTMLVRIPYDRNADRVAKLLAMKMEKLPEFMRNSVTWDQGKEMARHKDFSIATGIDVYFCDPHSPWQRGTNENTNGLLRQYFPKGTDLSLHTQADLDRVAEELNDRPRKTLGWKKPAEVFAELLESSVSP
jgi:IS30 family transposase